MLFLLFFCFFKLIFAHIPLKNRQNISKILPINFISHLQVHIRDKKWLLLVAQIKHGTIYYRFIVFLRQVLYNYFKPTREILLGGEILNIPLILKNNTFQILTFRRCCCEIHKKALCQNFERLSLALQKKNLRLVIFTFLPQRSFIVIVCIYKSQNKLFRIQFLYSINHQ